MKFLHIADGSLAYATSPTARECIEAFESLLATHCRPPSQPHEISASRVIRLGFPLTLLSSQIFSEDLFKRIAKAFCKVGDISPDDFSELQSLALLGAFGATEGGFVPRSNGRTHDFELIFDSNAVEVEVTKASEKEAHRLRATQANRILELIYPPKKSLDVNLHIADLLPESCISRLVQSTNEIAGGELLSEEGRWQVAAKPIEREPHVVFIVGEDDPLPQWWPKEAASLLTFRTMVGGPDEKFAHPRVKITYAVPISGYLNSAKKKATRFQGSRTKPCLLVIDANSLPNPFSAFDEGLKDLFCKWPHISGVLVFSDHMSLKEIGWTWQAYINPHAKRPLPAGLEQQIGNHSTPMNTLRNFLQ